MSHQRSQDLTQREQTTLLPELFALWSRYVADTTPPYLDRWLGRALSALDGLPRQKRLWLGARLTDGVRFAWLALLCQEASGQAPWIALDHVQQGIDDPREAWPRLQALPPADLFFWVFLRLREQDEHPPRLDEPRPGAVNDWHRIRTGLNTDPDLLARLIWQGLPASLAPLLDRRATDSAWSREARRLFLDRQVQRPPLWLRLADPTTAAAVLAELRQAGFRVDRTDEALSVRGDRGIHTLDCVRQGKVEIQDLASQAIGRAVAVEPGQFVWDCCAGGGGKSLQLAAAMRGTGAVYATDINEAALADLRQRARRAGATNVRAYPWDGTALPDFGKSVARRGGFDRVLVDAPCSGCGTWRRNPDGRLRSVVGSLGELTTTQARLLAVASGGVKPGGRLTYATCSWLVEENEDVVADFLAGHPGFALVAQAIHGNPALDADTTFSAVLQREDD